MADNDLSTLSAESVVSQQSIVGGSASSEGPAVNPCRGLSLLMMPSSSAIPAVEPATEIEVESNVLAAPPTEADSEIKPSAEEQPTGRTTSARFVPLKNSPLMSGKSWSRSNRQSLQPTASQIAMNKPPATTAVSPTQRMRKSPDYTGGASNNLGIASKSFHDEAGGEERFIRPSSTSGKSPPRRPPPLLSAHELTGGAGGRLTPVLDSPGSSFRKSPAGSWTELDYDTIYERNAPYKYMPLELASSPSVKNSIAKTILHQSLGRGMVVIKHGSVGIPKKRLLFCDSTVTKLYWTSKLDYPAASGDEGDDPFPDVNFEDELLKAAEEEAPSPTASGESESRLINIADIVEIRLGTEIDPQTPEACLRNAAKAGVTAAVLLLKQMEERKKIKAHENYEQQQAMQASKSENDMTSSFGSSLSIAAETPLRAASFGSIGVAEVSFSEDGEESAKLPPRVGLPSAAGGGLPRSGSFIHGENPSFRPQNNRITAIKEALFGNSPRNNTNSLRQYGTASHGSHSFGPLFDEYGLLYGTENLRRKCKKEDLPYCLSLIFPKRTVDFQCLNKKDLNMLHINLKEILLKMKSESGVMQPVVDAAVSSLVKKLSARKPVRFSFHEREDLLIKVKESAGATIAAQAMAVAENPSTTANVEGTAESVSNNETTSSTQEDITDAGSTFRGSGRWGNSGRLHKTSRGGSLHVTRGSGGIIVPEELLSEPNIAVPHGGSMLSEDSFDAAEYTAGSTAALSRAHQRLGGVMRYGSRSRNRSRNTIELDEEQRKEAAATFHRIMSSSFAQDAVIEPVASTEDEIGTSAVFQVKGDEDVDVLLSRDLAKLDSNMSSVHGSDPIDERKVAAAAALMSESPTASPSKPTEKNNFASIIHPKSAGSVGSKNPYRIKAREALQIGLILSQQEATYGTNMYQSLQPEDEPVLEKLIEDGFTTEEGILQIFQRKFAPELFATAHEEGQLTAQDAGSEAVKSSDDDQKSIPLEEPDQENLEEKRELVDSPHSKSDVSSISPQQSPHKVIKQLSGSKSRPSPFFPKLFLVDDDSDDNDNVIVADDVDAFDINYNDCEDEELPLEVSADIHYDSAESFIAEASVECVETSEEKEIDTDCHEVHDMSRKVSDDVDVGDGKSAEEEDQDDLLSTSVEVEVSKCGAEVSPLKPVEEGNEKEIMVNLHVELNDSSKSDPHLNKDGKQESLDENFVTGDVQDVGTSEPDDSRSLLPESTPGPAQKSAAVLQLAAMDAMQIGLLLSQQEREYGINMYEALQESDEEVIRELIEQLNYTTDEAVLEIFNRRYASLPASMQSYNVGIPDQVKGPAGGGDVNSVNNTNLNGRPTSPASSVASSQFSRPAGGLQSTLSQSSLFPNDPARAGIFADDETVHSRSGHWGSFYSSAGSATGTSSVRSNTHTIINPRHVNPNHNLSALNDTEAMQMALLLSQQEDEFGVNMYDDFQPGDEPEMQFYLSQGLTNEEAIFRIFDRKHPSRRPNPLFPEQRTQPQSQYQQHYQSSNYGGAAPPYGPPTPGYGPPAPPPNYYPHQQMHHPPHLSGHQYAMPPPRGAYGQPYLPPTGGYDYAPQPVPQHYQQQVQQQQWNQWRNQYHPRPPPQSQPPHPYQAQRPRGPMSDAGSVTSRSVRSGLVPSSAHGSLSHSRSLSQDEREQYAIEPVVAVAASQSSDGTGISARSRMTNSTRATVMPVTNRRLMPNQGGIQTLNSGDAADMPIAEGTPAALASIRGDSGRYSSANSTASAVPVTARLASDEGSVRSEYSSRTQQTSGSSVRASGPASSAHALVHAGDRASYRSAQSNESDVPVGPTGSMMSTTATTNPPSELEYQHSNGDISEMSSPSVTGTPQRQGFLRSMTSRFSSKYSSKASQPDPLTMRGDSTESNTLARASSRDTSSKKHPRRTERPQQQGEGGGEIKRKRSIFSLGFKKRSSSNTLPRQMTARFGCNEKDVRTIMSLGFTRDQAVASLSQNNHDLLLAINGLTL